MSTVESTVPENLKARMKESYDAIAEVYNTTFTREDDPIRLEYVGRLLKHLQESDAQTASVLELGCGAGVPGTKTLLQHERPSIHVTANDLSSTQIELARKNLASYSERLVLRQGDMLELSFDDNSLDAVIGLYSIIHLPREEQVVLVNKIARWLKPGGLFLANFSEAELPATVNETWLEQEKGWVFWSGWGGEKSAKVVEDAGLNVLAKETRHPEADAAFLWILARKN